MHEVWYHNNNYTDFYNEKNLYNLYTHLFVNLFQIYFKLYNMKINCCNKQYTINILALTFVMSN